MSKVEVNQISSQCGSTLTIGQSGDTVTLAAGATQTGFGRTGTVDWDTTAKTASFTAVSGNGYFVNTTSGAVTMTLPATPSAGDIVSIADYTNTFQTNSVTVARNGSPIGGISSDAILSTEGQSVTFIYVDGTEGWKNVQDSTSNVTGNPNLVATGGTITTCGDYKIHTFTGPGTFTVAQTSTTPANNTVSYMVVAGGGAGGAGATTAMGGGGAGGFREYKSTVDSYTASPLDGNPGGTAVTVTATAYPITVGAGGSSGNHSPCGGVAGNPGSNSIFSTITSAGGGAGSYKCAGPLAYGTAGGSGGGGGPGPFTGTGSYYCGPGCAGAGNTPPVTPPQGNAGGTGFIIYNTPPGQTNIVGGGGGGATAVGTDGTGSLPSTTPGGAGATTSISGSSSSYSGGGGGGALRQGPLGPSFPQGGTGGLGGGGAGGQCGDGGGGAAVSATVNTGGGGGGTGNSPTAISGTGGSGIVIIRYKYQ
jgi:hypothetical protein